MPWRKVTRSRRIACCARSGDSERLNLFPLFPHDIALDAEMARIALAAEDDELVTAVVAAAERRSELNPGVRSIQAAAAHVRGLVKQSASRAGRCGRAVRRGRAAARTAIGTG